MVVSNVTHVPPSTGRSSTAAVFDRPSRPSGTKRVTRKVALCSGSSQHGKARRASVDSNWVVAMMRSTPSVSVKVLR